MPWRGLLPALLSGALPPTGCAAAPPRAGDGQGQRVEAWLYGNVDKYAYYYAELLIGSPEPQRTSVIVDTGSHIIGFPCKGCVRCGDHIDPAYDFSRSESAEWLNCSSTCDDCTDGDCRYQVSYSEGSAVSGRWFTDLVRFEGPSGRGPAVRTRLGCHRRESRLFLTQRADGIMGLAPHAVKSNLPFHRTILDDIFQDTKHINASVFSLCFSTWGGRLMLGGYEPSYDSRGEGQAAGDLEGVPHARSIQWLSMTPKLYYVVYPTGLMLGDLVVGAGQAAFGTTVIDSGTTYSSFPGPLYQNILNDVQVYCALHDCGAKQEGFECWRLTGVMTGPRDFPTLRMQFGPDGEIEWPPHAYLHQAASPDLWCISFQEGDVSTTILGISWMLHKDIIFDLEQHRLGVVRTVCPERGRPSDIIQEVSAGDAAVGVAVGRWFPGVGRGRQPPAVAAAAAAALLFAAASGSLVAAALRVRAGCRGCPPALSAHKLSRELWRGPMIEEEGEAESSDGG